MGLLLGGRERRAQLWTPEPAIPPYPGTNRNGYVTTDAKPDMALAVPAVWACVGLIANTVSSMALQTYRRPAAGSDAVPERIGDSALIASPMEGVTQAQFLHTVMVSLLLRGNAIGRITSRDYQTRPTQITLLDPDTIRIIEGDDGLLSYRYRRNDQPLPAGDVWHLAGMTMPGSRVGLAPISYAAATLGVDLGSREFASQFFGGGGVPKAILTSDQTIDQSMAERIKAKFMAAARGREPVVLGQGLTYNTIQIKPEESQFLATQAANVAQVARYFWVPPELIGASGGNSLTYANVEQRNQDFLTLSIGHWLKRIEDSLSALLPAPVFVKFDVSQLLRTDAETQAKVALQYLAGKVLAPSEVRTQLGLAPMTKAQKDEAELVPLQPTPLGNPKAALPKADPADAAESEPSDAPGGPTDG